MKKAKTVSWILKIIFVFLIFYGIYNFFYWELWTEKFSDLFVLLQIIYPFLFLGILGIFLGIITIIDIKIQ